MQAVREFGGVGVVVTGPSDQGPYSYETFTGDAHAPYVEELAKMQLLYERSPYYCRANFADDLAHINRFRNNPNSISCLVFCDGKIVAAAMGRPQLDVGCVKGTRPDEGRLFHLSHCLVLPEIRDPQVMENLYKKFEEQIIASPHFDRISCAIVNRPKDFRLAVPQNDDLFDAKLAAFAFKPVETSKPIFFEYTLVDESADSKHPMVLWEKRVK